MGRRKDRKANHGKGMTPLGIVLLYAMLGGLWIIFSDSLLASFVADPSTLTRLQTLKGWFFVAVTAALLAVLLGRYARAQNRARDELQRLAVVVRDSNDAITVQDLSGEILAWNQAAERLYGYSEEEARGLNAFDLVPEEDRHQKRDFIGRLKAGEGVSSIETRRIAKDGRVIDVLLTASLLKDEKSNPFAISTTERNITDRKKAEASIRRLMRVRTMLSNINQLIVRERNRLRLFDEACRIAVADGGFLMAWIGAAEEGSGVVRPLSSHGRVDGYLDDIRISLGDEPLGRGPTGSALSSGQPFVCNDIENDERMAPWREEALRRGFRSSAAFPITSGDRVVGAFNLYAADPYFFDKEEVPLLEALTANISHALDVIRIEEERRQAEESLMRSEAKLRAFFESNVVGTLFGDVHGGISQANDEFLRIVGYTREELGAGKVRWTGLTPPEWLPLDEEKIAEAREKKGCAPYEKQYIRKDGTRVWVLVGYILAGEKKEDSVAFILDLTRTKEAEEKQGRLLAERDELLKRLRLQIQRMPIGYILTDREFRFTYLNPAAERIFGYSTEELFGRSPYGTIIPESARAFVEERRRLWMKGDMSAGGVNENISKYGKIILCEWFNTPIMNEEGEFDSLLSMVQDVTSRKKAEEEIRTTNEELQAINHVVTAVTGVLSPRDILHRVLDEALNITGLEGGTICLVNPDETLQLAAQRGASQETIWDLTAHEIKIGDCLCGECARDMRPLILPDREAVLDFSTREAQRGEDIRFHAAFPLATAGRCLGVLCVFTRTDRKPQERRLKLLETVTAQISLAVRNAQLYEETVHHAAELEDRVRKRTTELEQNRQALLKLVHDLNEKTSQLLRANERLKEMDRLKSMFIASMSHELRTPLNSVIGFSSIVLNEWIGPLNDEQKENLSAVLSAGRLLLALINDVIDVSKIEAGFIDRHCEDFDLAEVVQETVQSFEREIHGKNLGLTVEASPVPMHTDRRRLLQCITNLLSNAVKFTEKGNVMISARRGTGEGEPGGNKESDVVEISVEDTGIGISQEDIPRLFSAFVRLESPLRARVPGTGLGLYLTKKLAAEILKGGITVESEYGKGSRFTLRIPVNSATGK